VSFFGTDGIRGRAGEGKLSDAGLDRMGAAIGAFVGAGGRVVIGRDTRESGPNIQSRLQAQLIQFGVDVIRLGVVPTPATAWLTGQHKAKLGIMITASHNPWHDNGVKLFSPDGQKLSDADQTALERLIETTPAPSGENGAVKDDNKAAEAYLSHILSALGTNDLSTLKVAVDAANGAGHSILAKAFEQLGSDVVSVGAHPDGKNINAGVGSTAPDALIDKVIETGADVGFALDGDADRILAVTGSGKPIDGDQIIARLALDAKANGGVAAKALVSTVMANLGLENWCAAEGLAFHRTPVGDRHVAKTMRDIGATIGGEPSGHILITDYATTGDGCLTALMLAASLVRAGADSDTHFRVFAPVPQNLKSVRFTGEKPLHRPAVKAVIAAQNDRLAGTGRILVRASGTEPVIRVMAEGDDEVIISDVVEKICDVIQAPA
jgi:phosphoglucosamine mutase